MIYLGLVKLNFLLLLLLLWLWDFLKPLFVMYQDTLMKKLKILSWIIFAAFY